MSKQTVQMNVKGVGDEVLRAVHASKSYVGPAVLTLVLYYLGFYIIGLICNLIFISQANASKRIAGVHPTGRGCLFALLWFHLLIPLLLLFLFLSGSGLFAFWANS